MAALKQGKFRGACRDGKKTFKANDPVHYCHKKK
jgi:hypothetical protein